MPGRRHFQSNPCKDRCHACRHGAVAQIRAFGGRREVGGTEVPRWLTVYLICCHVLWRWEQGVAATRRRLWRHAQDQELKDSKADIAPRVSCRADESPKISRWRGPHVFSYQAR